MNNIEHSYLKNKIENIHEKEKVIPRYFNEQITPYTYHEKDTFYHNFNNTEFTLEYENFKDKNFLDSDGEHAEIYRVISETIKKGVINEGINIDKNISDSLKIINKLSLEKKNDIYNIFDILPDDYVVTFLANWKHEHKKNISIMNPERKFIFIGGDILTPENLIALSHEIGHLQDFSQMSQAEFGNVLNENRFFFSAPDEYIQSVPVEHREHLSSSVLKRERDAWYFGLSGMRPFFTDLGIDQKDVINFVHEKGLRAYSKRIKEKFIDISFNGKESA